MQPEIDLIAELERRLEFQGSSIGLHAWGAAIENTRLKPIHKALIDCVKVMNSLRYMSCGCSVKCGPALDELRKVVGSRPSGEEK